MGENLSQIFYFSVFGLITILGGAFVMNMMLNLSDIADSLKGIESGPSSKNKKLWGFGYLLLFPLIFDLLFLGDKANSNKKQKHLVNSAKILVQEHDTNFDHICNYKFDLGHINKTHEYINVLMRTEENFPYAQVIVRDTIEEQLVFLNINHVHMRQDSNNIMRLAPKSDFIMGFSKEERQYLNEVFDNKIKHHKFSAHDGNFELFYPVEKNGKKVVLLFQEHQRYGKM